MFKRAALIGALICAAATASAEDYVDLGSAKKNAILVNASMNRGGFALGADFEHSLSNFGIGAYARFYQENDNPAATGVFSFGAFIRPHFTKKGWNLYFSPALGIHMVDPPGSPDAETGIGPGLMTGILYQISGNFSVGVEHLGLYAWFIDESVRGQVVDDLALKVRFMF